MTHVPGQYYAMIQVSTGGNPLSEEMKQRLRAAAGALRGSGLQVEANLEGGHSYYTFWRYESDGSERLASISPDDVRSIRSSFEACGRVGLRVVRSKEKYGCFEKIETADFMQQHGEPAAKS